MKNYIVTLFLDGREIGKERWQGAEADVLKRFKKWAYQQKLKDFRPRFTIEEEKRCKPLTSLFLSESKRSTLSTLMKSFREKYASYDKEDIKRKRLKELATNMWNSLQDEFFHTADISDNSIWKWQDKLAAYEDYEYLYDVRPAELSDWSVLLKGWYHREWAVEVLKLVKDFNLDNENPEYVLAFKNDFKSVKNEQQFISAIYKWSDLIYWSPWKLSLLENSFEQPRNVHYEDDFNPDVDDGDDLF